MERAVLDEPSGSAPRCIGKPFARNYRVGSRRRVLCVYPRYVSSFGTFHHSYPLVPGVRAFVAPQGIAVVAACLPDEWDVRVVDENIRPVRESDYRWADVVFVSGMHAQRSGIELINEAAHRRGKLTVLGGPSVSSCPEYYPNVDVLHIGEIGDATDALIGHLDATVERPVRQMRFETREKLPIDRFPTPALHLLDLRRYFLSGIQFSSGCPHGCEFCDIPELYGRTPRVKSPEQVTAELDLIATSGNKGMVYFVDDNFISRPKAAEGLLHSIIDWQRSRGYPLRFACETTLDLAGRQSLLELMREAGFTLAFCGIESPDPGALEAMHKEHNLRMPMMDAIRTINSYGLEIAAGIILGLDTDTPETVDQVISFINDSAIPLLTINILYALPNTPLYRRLHAEGRISEDRGRESNVVFREPYESVVAGWRRCIAEVYSPARLMERFAHQARHTYRNRLPLPRQVRLSGVVYGARVLGRVLWKVGCRSDYRGEFWKVAGPLLRAGRIEDLLSISVPGHHLISHARECIGGAAETCFYADPSRSAFRPSQRSG